MFFGVRLYFSISLFSLIFTLFCISLTSFQMFFVFFLLKHFAVTIQVIDGEADKIFFDTSSRTKNAVITLITTNTCYVWIKIGSAHKFLMSLDLDFHTPNEF